MIAIEITQGVRLCKYERDGWMERVELTVNSKPLLNPVQFMSLFGHALFN